MCPGISWSQLASSGSRNRLNLLLGHQKIRHMSYGLAFSLGYKIRLPQALTTLVIYKSLNDYFSKRTARKTTDHANNRSTVNRKQYSQALSPPKVAEETGGPTRNELPRTDSHFRMTEELFQAAKQAEPGSINSFWSHRLYRGPIVDGIQTRPIVHYCRTSASTERVLQSYFMDKSVIGFDIEWKSDALKFHGPRANVSLIQIASEERIGLFHVALFPSGDNLVSPSMRKMMEDPIISKVGVAIKGDCTRIRRHLNIECQGLFELSHLFKLVKFSQNREFGLIDRKLVSLEKQVEEHFHLPLFKGAEIRYSDWSNKLQLHQILYAAADSYAAIQLYKTLELKRKSLNPTPPRPHHAELNLPIQFFGDANIMQYSHSKARALLRQKEKSDEKKALK